MLHKALPQPVTHSSLGQLRRESGIILPAFGMRDAFQIKPSWHRKPVQQLFDSSGDKKHSTFGSSTSIIE